MRELSVAIRKPSQSTQLGLVLGSDDDLWEPMTISEINPEGLAHRSALRTGDRVVAINSWVGVAAMTFPYVAQGVTVWRDFRSPHSNSNADALFP